MPSSSVRIKETSTPVLIVEDNPVSSKLLEFILQGFGYREVRTAESTEQAYDLVSQDPAHFKLLFVDYYFPAGDTGAQFLARLKAQNWLETAVAFLVTYDPSIENQREAMQAGACGVVVKPFDRDRIMAQIEKADRLFRTDNLDNF